MLPAMARWAAPRLVQMLDVNPVAVDYLLLERVGRLIQSGQEHRKRGLTSFLAHMSSATHNPHIFSTITRGWLDVLVLYGICGGGLVPS